VPASPHPEAHPQLVPGYRLDRYELLCPVGKGGMATVWVARLLGKHGFEKLVAIKTILPHFAQEPRFHGMFLDEARIASGIQHVNVAQILDLGDEDGVVFLAMEWVEGDALSRLARRVHEEGLPFPPGIALRILADVCSGLHAAHELRDRSGASLEIVHRDVSPHNILISHQGIAKVIDFGIAKARDRLGGDTDTGSFKGKVRYVAPEQALTPRTADRRADIWSVGAVLYSLVAGRAPYEAENDMATLGRIASGRPPAPLPSTVHRAVRDVAHQALALRPEDRPATAEALRAALEGALREMGLGVTSADVAAFHATHLADRIEARASAVAAALAAAEARARGTSGITRASAPRESAPWRAPAAAGESGAPTAPDTRTPLAADSVHSLATEADVAATASAVVTRARRRWGLAGAALAFALLAFVVVLFGRHRRESAGAHVAAPAAPAVSAIAVPAPPTAAQTAAAEPSASSPASPSPLPEPPGSASAVPASSPPAPRRPSARPVAPPREPPPATSATVHRSNSYYGF
jgi:eukaryotic-like serine/threonine-protein kinase